jgi:hypothetical protein
MDLLCGGWVDAAGIALCLSFGIDMIQRFAALRLDVMPYNSP